MSDNKRSKVEPEHIEEAKRLKALFDKRPRPLLSQAEFGDRYKIGSQGAVWQYLNARTPLSVKAAIGFARGLDCSVDDFSPRLAAQMRQGHEVSQLRSSDSFVGDQTKGAPEGFFSDRSPSNVLHHLPVITWEMVMEGFQDIGRWKADNDYITRELHAPKGWWIIVDTRVQFAPGDIVLIRCARESLALRRIIGEAGDLHLVTLSGSDAPTPTDGSEIVGVACGSFMEMEGRLS